MINKIINGEEVLVSEDIGNSITLNGNPLQFNTDSEQVSTNTVITLEPIQNGSGDPSPSNVRSISGYNEINVLVPRKNLFNINRTASTPNQTSHTNTNSRVMNINNYYPGMSGDNYYQPTLVTNISISNNSISFKSQSGYGIGFPVVIDPNSIYYISYTITTSGIGAFLIGFYDKDWNYLSYYRLSSSGITFTIPSNAHYAMLTPSQNSTSSETITISNIQLELSSSATSYEPYNPMTDILITPPQTVYGGSLDIETGKLIITHKRRIFTGTDVTWNKNQSRFQCNPSDINDAVHVTSTSCQVTSSHFIQCSQAAQYSGLANNSISLFDAGGTSGCYVGVQCDSYTTTTEFMNYLASEYTNGRPLTIIYPLATPITYQLSPHQVKLLQGANVVTTNGTSIQLTYREGDTTKLSDLSGIADSINAIENSSIFVIADGVKTCSTLFSELYSKIDFSKITDNSRIIYQLGDLPKYGRTVYKVIYHDEVAAGYSFSTITSNAYDTRLITMGSTVEFKKITPSGITNMLTDVPNARRVFILYY